MNKEHKEKITYIFDTLEECLRFRLAATTLLVHFGITDVESAVAELQNRPDFQDQFDKVSSRFRTAKQFVLETLEESEKGDGLPRQPRKPS